MAFETRDHKGAAVPTTITADINATALTITIASATGWPSGGANGPFFVSIDKDLAGEEKIEVASRTGTTLTVASTGKRGIDDTTATSHTSGASIIHCGTAQDLHEANQHITNTALDHHPQYHTAARHAAVSHTLAMMGNDSVGSSQIVADSVGTSEIAPLAVTAAELGTDAVTTAKILDANVTAGKLAAGAVIAGKIGVGGISAADQFAAGVVDQAAIGANAVGTSELIDANVTPAKLAASLPRGIVVARQKITTDDSWIADANTDFTLSVTADATRLYKVCLHAQYVVTAGAHWRVEFDENAVNKGRFANVEFTSSAIRQMLDSSIIWEPTAGAKTLTVRVDEIVDGATFIFEATATNPRYFWVEDIGAR